MAKAKYDITSKNHKQLLKVSNHIETNARTKIDTETDTCIESLVSIKHHLIDPIAKIVDDYTKNYKFKGKSAEKIELSYTICCDENKNYDHADTILLDIATVDDEIFILNNCFNISVYNHINRQMTREFELDLQCVNFRHYLTTKYGRVSRTWEFSNNKIKFVKMFISKLNNEILLCIQHSIGNYDDDDSNTGKTFVFNSLNGMHKVL